MIQNKSGLIVKVEDRVYEFLCGATCPLGEVHDALVQMKKFVVELIEKNQKTEEEAAKEANKTQLEEKN